MVLLLLSLSYAIIIVAAFFNALMDATENTPNFNESILKNLDKTFWCKDVSWKYAKRIFGYKLDAWHLSKSAMIICFALAIIIFPKVSRWLLHLFIIGIVWNVSFWVFYHKIFKVK